MIHIAGVCVFEWGGVSSLDSVDMCVLSKEILNETATKQVNSDKDFYT